MVRLLAAGRWSKHFKLRENSTSFGLQEEREHDADIDVFPSCLVECCRSGDVGRRDIKQGW